MMQAVNIYEEIAVLHFCTNHNELEMRGLAQNVPRPAQMHHQNSVIT